MMTDSTPLVIDGSDQSPWKLLSTSSSSDTPTVKTSLTFASANSVDEEEDGVCDGDVISSSCTTSPDRTTDGEEQKGRHGEPESGLPHPSTAEVEEEEEEEDCPICYETLTEFHPSNRQSRVEEQQLQHDSDGVVPTFSLFDDDDDDDDYHDVDDPPPSSMDEYTRCRLRIRRSHRPLSERITMSGGCNHAFCRGCLRAHCQYAISTHTIPIHCPGTGCPTLLSSDEVEDILLVPTVDDEEQECDDDDKGGAGGSTSPRPSGSVPSRDGPTNITLDGNGSKRMSHYGSIEQLDHPPQPQQMERLPPPPQEQPRQTSLINAGDDDDDGRRGLCGLAGSGIHRGMISSSEETKLNEYEQDWIKFQRLQRMSVDSTLIACLRCQELIPIAPAVAIAATTGTGTCPTVDDDIESALSTRHSGMEFSPREGAPSSQRPRERREHRSRRQRRQRRQRSSQHGDKGDASNLVTCPSCCHNFCRIHGDAHPGQTCRQYEKGNRRALLEEQAMIESMGCKPCSHCNAVIQKEAGCDHIICTACHNDMCFKCGTHLYLEGSSMVRSCQNCQQSYIDHRHIWTYRATLCLMLPCYLPIALLHVVVVGAVAIATLGCFCCLGCGIQSKEQRNANMNTNANVNGNDIRRNDDGMIGIGGGFVLRPVLATQTVLSMIFLPLVDVIAQFGLPCCIRPQSGGGGHDDLNGNDEKDDNLNGLAAADDMEGGTAQSSPDRGKYFGDANVYDDDDDYDEYDYEDDIEKGQRNDLQ